MGLEKLSMKNTFSGLIQAEVIIIVIVITRLCWPLNRIVHAAAAAAVVSLCTVYVGCVPSCIEGYALYCQTNQYVSLLSSGVKTNALNLILCWRQIYPRLKYWKQLLRKLRSNFFC